MDLPGRTLPGLRSRGPPSQPPPEHGTVLPVDSGEDRTHHPNPAPRRKPMARHRVARPALTRRDANLIALTVFTLMVAGLLAVAHLAG